MKNFFWQDNFNLLVSRNDIRGASRVNKYGAIYGTAAATSSTVWTPADTAGTVLYPWSVTPGPVTVVSSSTSDTNGGVGAQTITVQGLDSNYVFAEETFTLSGQTPTAAGQVTFARVNRAFVTSGVTNVGKIQVKNSTTIVTEIAAGYGQTLQCVYTIPANKTGYLYKVQASASKSQETSLSLFFRPFGGAFRSLQNIELLGSADTVQYEFPIPLTEKTDLDLRVKGSTNSNISANYEILLLDNDN